MKFKLVAAAVIAAFGISSANAGTYNVGDLTALGSAGYAQNISFNSGSFADIFNFSLSGGSNDFAGIASKLSLNSSQLISSFTGVLTGPGSFSQSFAYNLVPLGGGVYYQALGYAGLLASGSYSLAINGSATTAGNYTTQLIASVPEPETYAMFLAGLGLMGFIARRRKMS